jgi:hypothetical protein
MYSNLGKSRTQLLYILAHMNEHNNIKQTCFVGIQRSAVVKVVSHCCPSECAWTSPFLTPASCPSSCQSLYKKNKTASLRLQ